MRGLWPLMLGLFCLSCADAAEMAPTAPREVAAGEVAMRRLTASQYRQCVWDVLGDDIELGGQLEPDNRRDGLLAVGSSHVTVTPTGLDQYEAMAYRVAEQALDEARRARNVTCAPASATEPDDACAGQFVARVGRLLFRRPLTESEVARRVALAREAAAATGDFYTGLEYALAGLLTSPHFLFRIPVAEDDGYGGQRLSPFTLASRLSFGLWNTGPDHALLEAAEDGALQSPEGLQAQIERLLSSDRVARGVRAFFSDLMEFDRFDDGFRKDGAIFPAYDQALVEDVREQTLLTLVEHLTAGRDFRQLFTSRRTFLSRKLGALYGVAVAVDEDFSPFEFPEGHPRAGLLTHASLLALHSHPGRSSATLRGAFVRAAFLCQEVPPPPGDVDFSLVEVEAESRPTLRDRVEAHMTDPACTGCHLLTDPIGLGLEQFDGLGRYRELENGATIDPSGALDGVPFDDGVGLGAALAEHPQLSRCLVRHVFMSVLGREPSSDEGAEMERLEAVFAASGYKLPTLWAAILGSPASRWTSGPAQEAP